MELMDVEVVSDSGQTILFPVCESCLSIGNVQKNYEVKLLAGNSIYPYCHFCDARYDLTGYVNNFISGSSVIEHSPVNSNRETEVLTVNSAEKSIGVVLSCMYERDFGNVLYNSDTSTFIQLLQCGFNIGRDQVYMLNNSQKVNGLSIAKAASTFCLYMHDYQNVSDWHAISFEKVMLCNESASLFFEKFFHRSRTEALHVSTGAQGVSDEFARFAAKVTVDVVSGALTTYHTLKEAWKVLKQNANSSYPTSSNIETRKISSSMSREESSKKRERAEDIICRNNDKQVTREPLDLYNQVNPALARLRDARKQERDRDAHKQERDERRRALSAKFKGK